jgi:hypothetical protein
MKNVDAQLNPRGEHWSSLKFAMAKHARLSPGQQYNHDRQWFQKGILGLRNHQHKGWRGKSFRSWLTSHQ